jgi:hypothetical protein
VTIGSLTVNLEMGWSQVCVFFSKDVGFDELHRERERKEESGKTENKRF